VQVSGQRPLPGPGAASGMGMSEQDLPARLVRYASEDPSDTNWTEDEVWSFAADCGLQIRRLAVTEGDTHRLGPDLSLPARDKNKDTRYPWSSSGTAPSVGSWTQ